MSNAVAKVFAIPELVEHFLLQLPATDILLSKQVNTTFRDGIDGSIQLQQKLWYLRSTARQPRMGFPVNPFLNQVVKSYSTTHTTSAKVSMNRSHTCEIKVSLACFMTKIHDLNKSFEDSWRSMLMMDPPCELVIDTCCGKGKYFTELEVADLRMGEVVGNMCSCVECCYKMFD